MKDWRLPHRKPTTLHCPKKAQLPAITPQSRALGFCGRIQASKRQNMGLGLLAGWIRKEIQRALCPTTLGMLRFHAKSLPVGNQHPHPMVTSRRCTHHMASIYTEHNPAHSESDPLGGEQTA